MPYKKSTQKSYGENPMKKHGSPFEMKAKKYGNSPMMKNFGPDLAINKKLDQDSMSGGLTGQPSGETGKLGSGPMRKKKGGTTPANSFKNTTKPKVLTNEEKGKAKGKDRKGYVVPKKNVTTTTTTTAPKTTTTPKTTTVKKNKPGVVKNKKGSVQSTNKRNKFKSDVNKLTTGVGNEIKNFTTNLKNIAKTDVPRKFVSDVKNVVNKYKNKKPKKSSSGGGFGKRPKDMKAGESSYQYNVRKKKENRKTTTTTPKTRLKTRPLVDVYTSNQKTKIDNAKKFVKKLKSSSKS